MLSDFGGWMSLLDAREVVDEVVKKEPPWITFACEEGGVGWHCLNVKMEPPVMHYHTICVLNVGSCQ